MAEFFNEIPQLISVSVTKKGYHTTINFNIEETEGGYTADSVTIVTEAPICEDDYGKIVSALVRYRFSQDEVEAIQLNYMESKTTEHKNQFAALKEWRAIVKERARAIIDSATSEE